MTIYYKWQNEPLKRCRGYRIIEKKILKDAEGNVLREEIIEKEVLSFLLRNQKIKSLSQSGWDLFYKLSKDLTAADQSSKIDLLNIHFIDFLL